MTSEMLHPQSGPVPDFSNPVSQPFWDGCAGHELRYQSCGDCGQANFPPVEQCRYCQSAQLEWTLSDGRGEIYSWTVVRRPVSPDFAAPYAPAIVTMREGYQILTNIIDIPVDELAVGMAVRVEFRSVADDLTLPYFTEE